MSAPQRLQGGQAVLNYRVLRELGSRAGPVYAAHRVVAGRMELAVLQHFKRPRDAASQLSGILRDARALAEVSHPNLMRVHNAEPVGEEIVVASDYVEGEALSALRGLARAQKNPFVLEVQLRIVMEVLAGLHALHGTKDARRRQIGLFHGFLTPVDIIVGLDGIVRVVGAFHTLPLRVPQELVPFSNYLAPEVRLGDRGVDRRADVYGAGALLWEALTGKAPFDDVPGADATRPPESPPPRPELPPDKAWAAPLVEVAFKAISIDPRLRFETAEDMLTAMQSHVRLAPQTTVAALVRQLAGDRILKRRAEFAEPRSQAEEDDPSVTAVSPQRASGVEKRSDSHPPAPDSNPEGDPTVSDAVPNVGDAVSTARARAASRPEPDEDDEDDEPSEDSITAVAPSSLRDGLSPLAVSHAVLPPASSSGKLPPVSAPRIPIPAGSAEKTPFPPSKIPLPTPPPSSAKIEAASSSKLPAASTKLPTAPATQLSPTSASRIPAASAGRVPVAPPVKEVADPSDVTEASVVTEVRAPIDSEADEDDDSVTRQAPVPRTSAPDEDDDDDDDGTATETLTRKQPVVDVVEDDEDEDEDPEDAVTAIAPMPAQVLPPGDDESVTKDRPPVGGAAKPVSPPPPRPSQLVSFPSPLELPGPMIAAPPGVRRVVAVDKNIDSEEALAQTMQAVSEQPLAIPPPPDQPFQYDDELPPPPSYKKLGIALGIAFFAAFALLVFVIIRAANQDDVVAEQAQSPRIKARHIVELPRSDDELAPRKRRVPPRWR